jgi:hypothetical protein
MTMNQIQIQKQENKVLDKTRRIVVHTLTTLANATQQIPGFNGNIPAELVMTNLSIPLTGSQAIGFSIGFMRG